MARRLPHANIAINTIAWPAGNDLHRVHDLDYGPCQFNGSAGGSARFSPIRRPDGSIIPTIYAGNSLRCALMETVFRDVSYAPGPKHLPSRELARRHHSVIRATTALTLADLTSVGLRKIGVHPAVLINSESAAYPLTRRWAEAIYAQHANIQGLLWTSRQDTSATALVLFEDRTLSAALLADTGIGSKHLRHDDATYDEVLDVADQLGVVLT